MAKDGRSGKPTPPLSTGPAPEPARHPFGPRALGSLLPPITRPAFKARSPACAQIMSDWMALAGPDLGARAQPRRLSGGTLTLAVSGPTALELQHAEPMIVQRINTALGRQTVERLRFVQVDFTAAEPVAPRRDTPAPVVVEGVPEGPLHDALARLGGHVAARAPRR